MAENGRIADNRKARFNYAIEEAFEAGIALFGSEVKSLRTKGCNIADSYAEVKEGEVWLINADISEYQGARHLTHEPKRPRKLLLRAKEIKRLTGKLKTKGLTMVPLSMYFNRKGLVKLEIALVKGKKEYEKRDTILDRDWQRQKERIFKDKW